MLVEQFSGDGRVHGLSEWLQVVQVVVADLDLFEDGLFLVFGKTKRLGDVVYVGPEPVDIALVVVCRGFLGE